MFLKQLMITNLEGLVRKIEFHAGLNLIIDETPEGTEDTGNNVGKTTLLRLIDFCMGGDAKPIYTTDGVENTDVKKFLTDTEAEVELKLVDSLDNPVSRQVTVRRNFLGGKKSICTINGQKVEKKDFNHSLQHALWSVKTDKPSFRQIISHSFRIDDLRLTQSLRTLNRYTRDVEYEALHLYLFGANIDDTNRKVELSNAIKTERSFKSRLEKTATLSALRSKLSITKAKIDQLNEQKEALNLNPDFEEDLVSLGNVKHRMSQLAVSLNNLKLRKSLIEEAADDMMSLTAKANASEIEEIYRQASVYTEKLHHTFAQLLHFHNEMLNRRAGFITAELPSLEAEIRECKEQMAAVRLQESELEKKLNLSVSYEGFDNILVVMSNLHQELGSLQQSITQIEEVEKRISIDEEQLRSIDDDLFSEARKNYVQAQIDKFNLHFASISEKLYGESYAIKGEIVTSKDGKPCYKFLPFATDNFGSGKKQGEITCFDLAYVLFADEEHIPCLHFILNDKKELMHGNQLLLAAQAVEEMGSVQYVSSILRDKLPASLDDERYFVLKLSQHNRLFRIE